MPFINPLSFVSSAKTTTTTTTTTTTSSANTKFNAPTFATQDGKNGTGSDGQKYRFVEEILNAPDYYRVLNVTKKATSEEIRRAYIKRSRVCHPDKFVPAYPRATESFQLLSLAYETLSDPSSKLIYDLSSNKKQSAQSGPAKNPNDTLQRVLHQLFNEMMDGEFQTMRAFIYALNETNPGMHISEDAIIHIEIAFRKMREVFVSTQQYYQVVQFELMRLYELQQELRALSYFNIWGRMQLSITMCKVLLQLPIMINIESRQKQRRQIEDDKEDDDDDAQGILGTRIENALRMAVGLLETGERYANHSW